MVGPDPKADLRRYLQLAREAVLWKLDGLSEYDVRRPMVPTGTNLLGLVKHLASIELLYFGAVFGRPTDEPLPWFEDDAEPNADMWATAEESRNWAVQSVEPPLLRKRQSRALWSGAREGSLNCRGAFPETG